MESETSHDDSDRPTKTLRSSRPDLKVILGSSSSNEKNECILWYHSQTLASKSKYIDTMLSTPMKEKDDLTISFPDITIGVWERMMLFLDSPIVARQMKARDASELAVFYDKYEFDEGRKLCEVVIIEYMELTNRMEKKNTLDLDFIIELVDVTHRANMEEAFKVSMEYIWEKLRSADIRYGRLMFTEENLKKLSPLLKYSKNNRDRIWGPYGIGGFQFTESNLITGSSGWDGKDDLVHFDDEQFAKVHIARSQKVAETLLLRQCISHIELSGTSVADGAYEGEDCCWDVYVPPHGDRREGTWNGQLVNFVVKYWTDDDFAGWAIVRKYCTGLDEEGNPDLDTEVELKCWTAPYSQNLKWPPRRGWVPADQLARGDPKIEYILHEKIV